MNCLQFKVVTCFESWYEKKNYSQDNREDEVAYFICILFRHPAGKSSNEWEKIALTPMLPVVE